MASRKVLLIGNGLTRGNTGISWADIIVDMAKNYNSSCYLNNLEAVKQSSLSMPLQAVVASHNNIDSYMKLKKNQFYGNLNDENRRALIQKILSAGFDDILTTNYSYEVEIAATESNTISDYALGKIREKTNIRRAEAKYFLHTYNRVNYKDVINRVWHIHGSAKNPSSMVIGHYYYGMLVSKYSEYLKKVGNSYEDDMCRWESWLDSFILGDVYVLGYGLSPSEFDLWWLIERKNREKRIQHGKIYYYAPYLEHDMEFEKYALMDSYGVIVRDNIKARNYDTFYKLAIDEIIKEVNNPR